MIKIVCVGKIKEKFYRDGINEYLKRLSKYTKIEIVEVEDYNDNNKNIVLEKEKDLILKKINSKDYIITMEIEGNLIDSVALANKIDNILINNSNITFVIKNISNYKLSFSKLTFPHQLFRLILFEQIYRSFKIIKNETYHK